MLNSFYDEEFVAVGDVKLRLAIDFRTLDLIEGVVGGDKITPTPEVIARLFAHPPPLTVLGKVLYAFLRRHHPDVSLDEAVGVVVGQHRERAMVAMYALLLRAMNLGEPKAKDENPPMRRGALELS